MEHFNQIKELMGQMTKDKLGRWLPIKQNLGIAHRILKRCDPSNVRQQWVDRVGDLSKQSKDPTMKQYIAVFKSIATSTKIISISGVHPFKFYPYDSPNVENQFVIDLFKNDTSRQKMKNHCFETLEGKNSDDLRYSKQLVEALKEGKLPDMNIKPFNSKKDKDYSKTKVSKKEVSIETTVIELQDEFKALIDEKSSWSNVEARAVLLKAVNNVVYN